MNKESNSYTIIYAVVIVVLVALLLAFTSQILKTKQERNEAVDKMRQILASINIVSTNSDAEQLYNQYIVDAYLVDAQGNRTEGDAFETELTDELKKAEAERRYPVFEVLVDGNTKYILSMRGAGLWGPLWGFISLDSDRNTVYGAAFAHEGETPGLGAEIERPAFGKQFIGKQFFNSEGKFTSIAIVKAGKTVQGQDYVDGISGGTITSQGVDAMLKSSIGAYEPFLIKMEDKERSRHCEDAVRSNPACKNLDCFTSFIMTCSSLRGFTRSNPACKKLDCFTSFAMTRSLTSLTSLFLYT